MDRQKILRLLTFFPLLFTVIAFASPTMLTNKFQLSTEDTIGENFNIEINQFWDNHAQSDYFKGVDDKDIHTINIKTGNSKAIVISQGRNESVLKYKELAYDLYKQGYDIFLIDHRGQGLSNRLGRDAHRGHVEYFTDYVTDLTTFVNALQLPAHYQSRFLLSHSMGGTINALYLEEQAHPFQAAAFFSPMFSINLNGLPVFIAKIISYISDLICRWFSDVACYAPGAGAYSKGIFEGNKLTSSPNRYSSAFNFFDSVPETQLGGPTMRWVNQSLYATETAIDNADQITIPVLVIQSGADSVVTAEGQDAFLENNVQCNSSKLIIIPDARHELLLEQDKYRIPAITAALDFFQQYQQGNLTCIK